MAKIRKILDPENCTMSLGDHLEELRARLILALLGLVLGVVVSLIFGTQILKFIEIPYDAAMRGRIKATEMPQIQKEMLSFVGVFFDTLTQRLATDPNPPRSSSIRSRSRFFATCPRRPSRRGWRRRTAGRQTDRCRSTASSDRLGPAEAFVAYMKISLISGLILTAPWVFYQIWAFIAAGLYPMERRYVYRAVPFSAALFIIGALFFLFVIARYTLIFFLSFGDAVSVASEWTLQKYVSFVTVLMLVFGIAFQTPIAVFILVRTGLVSIQTLRSYRKYVIVGLAFVSAVATPSPDPFSMLALLVPLYALYELGIALSVIAEKKAKKKEQQAA